MLQLHRLSKQHKQNREKQNIQNVPLKTGPLARRNQESRPVLSGTLCIFIERFSCK
jgi:hypothetical protein